MARSLPRSVFKQMCINYGITGKPTSSYNPQSNGILERVHQVVGNMLRTFQLEEQALDTKYPFRLFLSAIAYAIRNTYHITLEATPAELVFGRNMLLPIEFKANWEAIRLRWQQMIDENTARENKTRLDHPYSPGDKVSLTKPGILPKMSLRKEGPYTVVQAYDNGTVRIRQGAVSQRVNIRRITPYRE